MLCSTCHTAAREKAFVILRLICDERRVSSLLHMLRRNPCNDEITRSVLYFGATVGGITIVHYYSNVRRNQWSTLRSLPNMLR